MQADLNIGGRTRKVIMQANKNGFFYVLDRETGEFISGAPFVERHYLGHGTRSQDRPSDRIASRSVRGTEARHRLARARTARTTGTRWRSIPSTGLVYLPAKVGTAVLHAPDPEMEVRSRTR